MRQTVQNQYVDYFIDAAIAQVRLSNSQVDVFFLSLVF